MNIFSIMGKCSIAVWVLWLYCVTTHRVTAERLQNDSDNEVFLSLLRSPAFDSLSTLAGRLSAVEESVSKLNHNQNNTYSLTPFETYIKKARMLLNEVALTAAGYSNEVRALQNDRTNPLRSPEMLSDVLKKMHSRATEFQQGAEPKNREIFDRLQKQLTEPSSLVSLLDLSNTTSVAQDEMFIIEEFLPLGERVFALKKLANIAQVNAKKTFNDLVPLWLDAHKGVARSASTLLSSLSSIWNSLKPRMSITDQQNFHSLRDLLSHNISPNMNHAFNPAALFDRYNKAKVTLESLLHLREYSSSKGNERPKSFGMAVAQLANIESESRKLQNLHNELHACEVEIRRLQKVTSKNRETRFISTPSEVNELRLQINRLSHDVVTALAQLGRQSIKALQGEKQNAEIPSIDYMGPVVRLWQVEAALKNNGLLTRFSGELRQLREQLKQLHMGARRFHRFIA